MKNYPKKSLGQNFLIDNNILQKISNLVKIKDKNVLEIGPGTGNLTKFLLIKKPKKLFVIEKDNSLVSFLREELMNKAESEIYSSEDGIGEFTQAYNFLYSKNVESHIPQDSELKKTIERYLEDNGDKALNLVGIWDILMELNKDKTAIRADMNQTYVDFTDLFLDKWNTLTPEGQGWATLQFLKGFGNHVHVLKLLPADLMSDNILSKFLPLYEKKLRNIIDAESTPEDLPSWHYAKNMTARDKRKNPTPYRTSRKELQRANKRLRENSIAHRKEQKENGGHPMQSGRKTQLFLP